MVLELPQKYRSQLYQKLTQHFNKSEIKDLCFEIAVDVGQLPDERQADMVRELILYLERHDRISELVTHCARLRPKITWTYQSKLFIGYKRHAKDDNQLAIFLHDYFTAQGHEVFIDKTLRSGEKWLDEIDQQIRTADFLIVLLSKESADSEMLQSEVQRAYEYRKAQGSPHILPVRLNYEGLLPYAVAAFLNQSQYILWQNSADNEQVGQEIVAAVNGRLTQREPMAIQLVSRGEIISEDGRSLANSHTINAPLPQFDPRELNAPGGAVKLRDKLYVEREADIHLKREIIKWGTTLTIRAPRQTGKTSLLMRGIHHARQNGAKVIFFDMQAVGRERLTTSETLLKELADTICHELRLDTSGLEKRWHSSLPAPRKLTYWLEDEILPTFDVPVILAIDEADVILQTSPAQDFFGLLRSWHNLRAESEIWEKLNLALVISTEPYLLIPDANQSPFNVGFSLNLADFTELQIRSLNQQHGGPIAPVEIPHLMNLLHGHPYLTRKCLFTLVTENMSWASLTDVATSDEGPFGDHLRRLFMILYDKPELQNALKQVIHTKRCNDQAALLRLLRAGLVKGSGDIYTCRCDLYHRYFKDKLR